MNSKGNDTMQTPGALEYSILHMIMSQEVGWCPQTYLSSIDLLYMDQTTYAYNMMWAFGRQSYCSKSARMIPRIYIMQANNNDSVNIITVSQ